jgi:predicted nucleotidyltransferase
MKVLTGVDEREIINEVIVKHVGEHPTILCGSRATGESDDGSDYDLFVVLPLALIPARLRRLQAAAAELEPMLGAKVTLNPLPAFRLRKPQKRLLVWKALKEGRAISSEELRVPRLRPFPLMEAARTSYALSGLRYLTAELDPSDLEMTSLRPSVTRGVRKALLHVMQLILLERGEYARTLADAADVLPIEAAEPLRPILRSPDSPSSWFQVRDLLVPQVVVPRASLVSAGLQNLQQMTLVAADGRGIHPVMMAWRQGVGTSLQRAERELAVAVRPQGPDAERVLAAFRELPPHIKPHRLGWMDVREAVEAAWPSANPLMGF